MDSRTRSASPQALHLPSKQDRLSSPPPQDKITAYYSLVFPHFTFYIQTLSVTIGRRCIPNPNTATSSTAEPAQVDVDLGALKSVSRFHAKIEYDQDEDRFVLVVIGRNGAWVDGVWSASGTRAPLSERSQIQIASRTFLFVLPPPSPPEDTPSPSSNSSTNRQRSPSLDITSISPPSSQPPNSPPSPVEAKLPPPPPLTLQIKSPPRPQPQLPNSNAIGKASKAANPKKRKKSDSEPAALPPRPKPEDMPPKPSFTYAQLIYRAIKAIGGKATLQEICAWIMNTYDYYRYADGAWMSSVRHNLSSGRAFKKMERCGGDRGKGFFWSLEEKYQHTFEEQEAKAQLTASSSQGGKDGKGGRKKDKGASVLEPPLKRSIKGDTKGGPLPPPLTSAPLAKKLTPMNATSGPGATVQSTAMPGSTGIFAYPTHPQHTHVVNMGQASTIGHASLGSPNIPMTSTPQATLSTTPSAPPTHVTSHPPQALASAGPPQTPVPDVIIPIILGPIPATHPDYSPSHPNNSAKEGYMVLHERTLILDPDVFSGLTKEMLSELEKMGARAALVVLTGHMVRALKERRARGREKGKGASRRGRGGGPSGRRPGSTKPGGPPFTNAPLERKDLGEAPNNASATSHSVDAKPVSPTIQTVSAADAEGSTGNPSLPTGAGSPILIVDDSEDEGPASKKRKMSIGVPEVPIEIV
ncbi:hypothetical protein BD779DRAFT_1489800 [Infundibulicybe gibba]|nr:hypothetical protein BD779DRAFT_1489800 [Infundibulicybe gibba]